jgi:purine catabolism regulator
VQNLLLHRAGSRDSVLDITPHELVDPDLAQMYAEELFAPLKDVPAAESRSLMATLRELMSASFNIGTAASRLKVHRHTVENRVVKLERLLGLDFADESARVRLWIAYSFIRDAEQA